MKPSDADLLAAIALVRAATFTPDAIYLAEDAARECGIDVDLGLAEGWIRRVDLEADD